MGTHKRLHILCTASWYPHHDIPTLGNFVQRHVECIATLHDVTVLYVASSDRVTEMKVDDSTIRGVRTLIVYCKRGMRAHVRAFQSGMRYLMNENEHRFDLIHHHVAWPHIWQAIQWGNKWNVPVVLTEHWTGFDSARMKDMKFWQRAYLRRMLRRVDLICPVSQQLGSAMRAFGASGRQVIVPNVVNTEIFHPNKQKQQRSKRMLHVSTLREEHKNIRGLLSAWKKVVDAAPDWTLMIGGDGPVESAQAWAKNIGIPDANIAWFGESTSMDIAAMMKNSDAFVLFSRYENLPCVILEAMACGLYIIATDVGGIHEHVQPEFGVLVKSEDESALRDAMLEFIQSNDAPTWNGDSSTYAEEHFSIAAIARQYDHVYRDLGL